MVYVVICKVIKQFFLIIVHNDKLG